MSDDQSSDDQPSDKPPQTEDPMTDTTDTDIEPAGGSESATGTDSAEDRTDEESDDGSDLRRRLNYALLGGLSLLALIATIQLYLNVSSAINQWVTYEYRSLFQAAFNLTVLLLVSTGMVWQVRRLRK